MYSTTGALPDAVFDGIRQSICRRSGRGPLRSRGYRPQRPIFTTTGSRGLGRTLAAMMPSIPGGGRRIGRRVMEPSRFKTAPGPAPLPHGIFRKPRRACYVGVDGVGGNRVSRRPAESLLTGPAMVVRVAPRIRYRSWLEPADRRRKWCRRAFGSAPRRLLHMAWRPRRYRR